MKNIYNLSFGVTSAVMTSLAIVVGLGGTATAMTITTALLIIAVADNISDSFGIHIYKESQCSSKKEVKETTFGNFIARLITTSIFIIFVIFLSTNLAMIFSVIFSLLSIIVMSYFISLHQKKNPYISILKHLSIAVIVLVSSLLLREIIFKIL
jgi:VIT1/CCC1 family predicted Fe2+/Mn2+ transporter